MHFYKVLFSYLFSVMLSSRMLLPFTDGGYQRHNRIPLQLTLWLCAVAARAAPITLEPPELLGCHGQVAQWYLFYGHLWAMQTLPVMIHIFISSTLHDFSSIHLWNFQVALFLKQVFTNY